MSTLREAWENVLKYDDSLEEVENRNASAASHSTCGLMLRGLGRSEPYVPNVRGIYVELLANLVLNNRKTRVISRLFCFAPFTQRNEVKVARVHFFEEIPNQLFLFCIKPFRVYESKKPRDKC